MGVSMVTCINPLCGEIFLAFLKLTGKPSPLAFYQNTMTKPTSTISKPIQILRTVFSIVLFFLYMFLYELPVSAFLDFKNQTRNRDKYLRQLVYEKFEQLENVKCLMLTQSFELGFSDKKKLFSILETVEFNGTEYTLISLQAGARIETKGLCIWKGEITRCYGVPSTGYAHCGGIERRFHI
jgi:hypothetical protein